MLKIFKTRIIHLKCLLVLLLEFTKDLPVFVLVFGRLGVSVLEVGRLGVWKTAVCGLAISELGVWRLWVKGL